MTILGVHVILGERAIIWADTEMMWHNGASAGHCNKVIVNAAAGMACASAGWAEMGIAAKAVACSAPTFDGALDEMPEALRTTAARYVRRGRVGSDPREYGDQVTIIAGWSERYGCIVAFEFAGYAFFAPIVTSEATHPPAPDFAPPCSLHDVVRVARAQMRELRADYPAIGGGQLCMAVVERHHVISAALYNLSADFSQDHGDASCCAGLGLHSEAENLSSERRQRGVGRCIGG